MVATLPVFLTATRGANGLLHLHGTQELLPKTVVEKAAEGKRVKYGVVPNARGVFAPPKLDAASQSLKVLAVSTGLSVGSDAEALFTAFGLTMFAAGHAPSPVAASWRLKSRIFCAIKLGMARAWRLRWRAASVIGNFRVLAGERDVLRVVP